MAFHLSSVIDVGYKPFFPNDTNHIAGIWSIQFKNLILLKILNCHFIPSSLIENPIFINCIHS